MVGIYLDYASATPIDPRVLEFARKFLEDSCGNPSMLHSAGLEAKKAVEDARKKVAGLINAEDEGAIVFTGSVTEANNLGIKGTALRNLKKGKRVAGSAIEHISVLNPMKELLKSGFELTLIPVDPDGLIDLDRFAEAVTEDTVVVSVMYANNEIGTIQPLREVGAVAHAKGAYLHVDAAAAAGFVPIDVQAEGIDLLALSSNALYGPQGVGALYMKPGVKLQPILPGGGQERGLRSGTENIFGIAAMGEAARLAAAELDQNAQRYVGMRDALIDEVLKIEEAYLTGHRTRRLPHHASFRFSGIEGESILLNMDMAHKIQVATGSACSSKTLEPSHVLLAIGLKHEEAHGSLVITLGRSTMPEDIPVVAGAVRQTVERLRMLSPLKRE